MAADFSISLGLVNAAQVATGLQSIIKMAGQLARKIAEIARETQNYSRVVRAHTVSVTEADAATDGLIDTMELHRTAARLERAEIEVTSNQMRGLAVAAADLARRTGVDATNAFRQLTQSVIDGNDRGLRPFGIRLDDVRDRSQRGRVALERLTHQFGRQTEEAQNLADEIYRLENAWGTAWSEMALTVEREGGIIREVMRGLTDMLNDLANALATQREAYQHMARMGHEVRLREIEQEVAGMGYSLRTGERREGVRPAVGRWGSAGMRAAEEVVQGQWEQAFADISQFLGAAGPGVRRREEARVRQLIAEYERLQREDIEAIARGAPAVAGGPGSVMIWGEEPRRRGGGAGREGVDPMVAAIQRQEALTTELIEGAQQAWQEIFDSIDQYAENMDRYAEQSEFYSGIIETQHQIEQELAEETATAVEEANQRKIVSIDEYRQRLAKEQEQYQETVSGLQAVGSVLGSTGKLFGEMGDIAEMAAGKQSRAVKALAAIEGAFLVGYNVAMGVTETAEAAASFASQDYVGGALHVVAAALYFVAAAKSAVELGVSSKGGAAGGGAGAGAAAPERDRGRQQPREQQPTIITINNSVVTSQRVQEDLDAMQSDASRRSEAA